MATFHQEISIESSVVDSISTIVKNLLAKWWWLLLIMAALKSANAEFGEYALITFRDTQQFPLHGIGFIFSMIMNFVLPVVTLALMITLAETSSKPKSDDMGSGLWNLLKEDMRVYGTVFLSFFLLIIPGIIKYVRLMFVPFVVFLEKEYREDQVDALAYSQALSKSRFFSLLGIIVMMQLAPILSWLILGELKFREKFVLATGNMLWVFLVEILAFSILLRMYLQARSQLPVKQGL